MDHRAEFNRLLMRDARLSQVMQHFGLTPDEAGLALHYARLSKVVSSAGGKAFSISPPIGLPSVSDGKSWCNQCERRVSEGEAAKCTSRWCKADMRAA